MHLRDVIGEALSNAPQMNGDVCVHARAEVASCRQCVDVCPTDAWVLDDEQLAIDMAACEGCGICIAQCPEGALLPSEARPLPRVVDGEVVLACPQTPDIGDRATVPCQHAIGLRQLTLLYSLGMRRLRLVSGECTSCVLDVEPGFTDAVGRLNGVLEQRGLAGIQIENAGHWSLGEAEARVSRRGFFRAMLDVVAEEVDDTEPAMAQPAGAYLPAARVGQAALYVPHIDAARCNGCDACWRVCIQDALRISEQSDAYLIAADRCTGCRLCEDVCDEAAVRIGEGDAVVQLRVPLQVGSCRACGARFHRPGTGESQGGLCPICTKANHRRNLFQVL